MCWDVCRRKKGVNEEKGWKETNESWEAKIYDVIAMGNQHKWPARKGEGIKRYQSKWVREGRNKNFSLRDKKLQTIFAI